MLFDEVMLPEERKPLLPVVPVTEKDFISDEAGVRWIDDWRLAEVLGIGSPAELHRSSARHREYLLQFGTLWKTSLKSSGGRPGTRERYRVGQAMFLTAASRQPGWQTVLIHLIQINTMWRDGELVARDPEAALKAGDSLADAYEAAPEVMRALHGDPLAGLNHLADNFDELREAIWEKLDEVARSIADEDRTEVRAVEADLRELALQGNRMLVDIQIALWRFLRIAPDPKPGGPTSTGRPLLVPPRSEVKSRYLASDELDEALAKAAVNR